MGCEAKSPCRMNEYLLPLDLGDVTETPVRGRGTLVGLVGYEVRGGGAASVSWRNEA